MKNKIRVLTTIFILLLNLAYPQTVYLTKTGKKYHKGTCGSLSRSSISIQLTDAIAKGYGPCGNCRPSATVSTNPLNSKTTEQQQSGSQKQEIQKQDSQNNNPSSSDSKTQYVQCTSLTKAGSQCKRMTKSANGKCWQHGGN